MGKRVQDSKNKKESQKTNSVTLPFSALTSVGPPGLEHIF